jgi:hypothetical protein
MLEYKWQSSTTDETTEAGFPDISPTVITETYDPPSGLTTTSWYSWLPRVTCMNDWIGCGTSNVVQISDERTPVLGSSSSSLGRWFLCLSKSLLCGI